MSTHDNPGDHSFMERLENCEKMSWTAKFCQNFPQEISVDRVERLGEINKGEEQITVLLPALFLK